ncbi:MAG: TonB family protein, partial [Albimonas sp.]|uniref:TonB family protein n=1 Tax=Albimonas sp. TaxID=1872425 RepID=UPI004056EF9A
WGARIRNQVQGRRELDRGRGEGEALVQLVVSADGALLSHAIQRSAGAALDRAAMRAVAAAAPFPAAPAGLGPRQRRFLLPVRFN